MALSRPPIPSTAYQHFKLPLLVSSISSTTPRRSFNRKNYLRHKLLRTLTIPYPNSLISISPNKNQIIQIESPNDKSHSGGGVKLDDVEFRGTGELAVEESVGILDSNAGNISEVPIFKIVLWLVGAFMFQTVVAVGMMLSSAEFDDENDNVLSDENKSGRLKIGLKEKNVSRLGFFQNHDRDMANGYSDGVVMQEKIEEIRMMAREVRERERMEIRKNDVESEDNDDEEEEDDFGTSGIEKEVKDRLVKMRGRLENGRGKFSIAVDDTVKKKVDRRHRVEANGLNKDDGNEAIIFKKYSKLKGSSSGVVDKSKGFMNLNKHSDNAEVMKDSDTENHMDEGISGSGVNSLNHAQKLDLEGANSVDLTVLLTEDDRESRQQAQAPVTSSKVSGKKLKKRRGKGTLGKKAGFGKSEPKGLTQDMEEGRPENEAFKSGESAVFEMSTDSNVNNELKGNDYLQMDQLYSEAELNKAGNRTGLWWLSLPYVLVIFMHTDLDDEGQRGLFTLRNSSEGNDTVSYTVAFEGHGDANNFCYILKTFFEDLEDFSAEVVPITIKELVGVVKSDYNRVIVVKKGQLRLYAGQPLPDVEMALRSLVGKI